MKLGKVFIALEEGREFRDMFQSSRKAVNENGDVILSIADTDRLADILDLLLDLTSQIEVGD